jgi:hypothetical protein
MLDVLHYFFEVDLYESTNEYGEARDAYRIRLYRELYEVTYAYATSSSRNASFDPDLPPLDEPVNDFGSSEVSNGVSVSAKAYVPPTEMNEGAQNPYNGVLDAPLN